MAESMAEQADRDRAERDRRQVEDSLREQHEHQTRTEEYMGADEFTVVAPYVTLKINDRAGGLVINGFNEGATVRAEDVDEDNLRHHVEIRFLVPKDSREARFAGPAGTPRPGEPPNVPVTEGTPAENTPVQERLRRQAEAAEKAERQAARRGGQEAGSDADVPAPGAGRPRQNAPVEEWREYAVTQRGEGTSEQDAREQVKAMSKSDIVARYGR